MTIKTPLLEDSLLVIWNDRNADSRLAEMKRIYSPDIHFYESDISSGIVGHEAINGLIAKLQVEWPMEFQFTLTRPTRHNHNVQVASWNLGPQGETPVASGMDVAEIEGDLIKSLYLFLDQ